MNCKPRWNDKQKERGVTQMAELLPCPFCGGKANIVWEPWKEISETAGIFRICCKHTKECYFYHIVGIGDNIGTAIGHSEKQLAEVWNRRADNG